TGELEQTSNVETSTGRRWSATGLGGAVASLIMVIATILEWIYVPRDWAGAQHLTKKFLFILFLFILNVAPAVYVFGIAGFPDPKNDDEKMTAKIADILGVVHFCISIPTFVF